MAAISESQSILPVLDVIIDNLVLEAFTWVAVVYSEPRSVSIYRKILAFRRILKL